MVRVMVRGMVGHEMVWQGECGLMVIQYEQSERSTISIVRKYFVT